MLAFYLFDPVTAHPTFLLATLVGFALSMAAQWRVKSAFRKYSQVGVRSGMTGAEAAAAVCRAACWPSAGPVLGGALGLSQLAATPPSTPVITFEL